MHAVMNRVPDLSRYSSTGFSRGRSRGWELLWIVIQELFVAAAIPGIRHRVLLLKLFGASVDEGVVIKPRVRVKFPWKLSIGRNAWIGEGVWIDNLAQVSIGPNACISQDAYLCTGSHDWSAATFDLIARPISVGAGAWIAARATVAPGVVMGEGAVLALGSTATSSLEAWGVYAGTPAIRLRSRSIRSAQKHPPDHS
jgi:putative colanic acid biosynthesis acetyltransferase WcaF